MKNSLVGILLSLRWPNLLITALTLCLSYYLLLIPINAREGLELNLGQLDFALLLFSTLLIMCGGYIINDWMDVESDVLNKKAGGITHVPRKFILIYYLTFTLGGLLTAILLSLRIGLVQLCTVQLLAATLLLFYSTHLKSTPLAGNIVIAFLSGLVPILPLIFDRYSYVFQFQPAFIILNFLSLFAFLITLIRELVKDMEDYSGDKAVDLATFPIIFGMEAARWTAFFFFMVFKILLLAIVYLTYGTDWISFTYLLITILIPSSILSFKLSRAQQKKHFNFISRGLKGIMVAGIGFGIIYHFSYL